MKFKLSALIALIVASLLLVSSANAADRPSPLTFLKDTNAKVTELVDKQVAGEAKAARDAELRTLIGGLIDYDDMARRSLGKHWEPLTEEQRTEYRSLFKQLVELTYIDRLGKREKDANYELEWEDEIAKGDKGSGTCFVLYEDTETELRFDLKAKEASWQIHDIAIDEASLEETYQRNYGKTIEKEGMEALLQKMRDKVKELGG